MPKYCDFFDDVDVDSIIRREIDVALRFGFRILKGRALRIARFGVWSYHHGSDMTHRGGPPGFWEVAQGEPVTGTVLQILTEDLDAGHVLYRGCFTTNQFSVRKNKQHYYWTAAAFVLRKLKELHERGPTSLGDIAGGRPWYPTVDRFTRHHRTARC